MHGSARTHTRMWGCAPRIKLGALGPSEEEYHVRGHHIGHLLIDLISSKTRKKSKMFEEIFNNQGLSLITENILIKLDVKSLLRCRLVCKGLHQFMKSLEKSRKLKKNDLKMIRRIRRKKLLIHSNWNAAFNSIIDEDNFYRRQGLIELLETYVNQDEIQTGSLHFDGQIMTYVNQDKIQTGSLQYDGQIMTNSYLNTSKFFNDVGLQYS